MERAAEQGQQREDTSPKVKAESPESNENQRVGSSIKKNIISDQTGVKRARPRKEKQDTAVRVSTFSARAIMMSVL